MSLLWEEQDAVTRLLGFERSNVAIGSNLYGPENDISALPYYYGYLGFGLFLCFVVYIFLPIAVSFVRNIRSLESFLTVDTGAWLMIVVFGVGAGQLSGNVLQNPSASVYLSGGAALPYCPHLSGRQAPGPVPAAAGAYHNTESCDKRRRMKCKS